MYCHPLRNQKLISVLKVLFATAFALIVMTALSYQPVLAQEPSDPPQLSSSAIEQIKAFTAEKQGRTSAQQKMDSRLLFALYKLKKDDKLNAFPDLRIVSPDPDGKILVDIETTTEDGIKPIVETLEKVGADLGYVSFRYRTIRARVPLAETENLAGLGQLKHISLARQAITSKDNTSEGDITHRAAEARNTFGVTGAGVKICVLSDGVDTLAARQASGDLPAVDVLPGQAGAGDEGTAMLEIVHDLAPGAELGFATAFNSFASFAQNIEDLRTDGCDIIVDDIIYFIESPFQDNDIAEAVNTVTADGALFFSSAGNEGNLNDGTSGTWEGDFNANGTIPALGPFLVHDFGDGGQSNLVTDASVAVTLHWTDPFGASGNDYDLLIMDNALATILDLSANFQDGDDDPVEITGPAAVDQRIVIVQFLGANRMIHVGNFRGELALATDGCTHGHNSAVEAFGTAAVNVAAALPGPFTGGGANPVEPFSCDGPRRIFFDNGGSLLPGAPPGNFSENGGVVRQKPDIAAADGVMTAAPGFNPFFGTSAAAPHAAAIAGLVKQTFPAETPAGIRSILTSSALDIEAAGVDRDSGAGIVMAYEAIQSNTAILGQGTVTKTQTFGDGDNFIEVNESWNLDIDLNNFGGVGATAINATLSTTTPGVTVISATSTYPNLSTGGSAPNNTPFAFTVGSGATCGVLIDFTLTVAFSGGLSSPVNFAFSLPTGQPGTPALTSFTGPPVPIPDFGGGSAVASLAVSGFSANIADLNFSFDGTICTTTSGSTTVGLEHSAVRDLEIELQSPTGITATIINRTDLFGNNFCQTVLDDESAGPSIQSVVSGDAPFTGSFTPNSPLSAFDGQPPNGTWNLEITDQQGADVGNIRAFSLEIAPAVCDAVAADLSITKAASPDPVIPGKPLSYTLSITNAGPDTASTITATDNLPAGVTYGSASGSGWSCGQSGGTVTCTRPNLPVGPAPDITIDVTAPPTEGDITNMASVSSTALDSVPANGSSSIVTKVEFVRLYLPMIVKE